MILQIFCESLKPGCEAEYSAIEEDTARNSAQLKCPHPYLGMESLTGPKEVWWLNAFDSEEHRQRVEADYAKNRELMQVLERNSKRKASLTETPVNIFATFSGSSRWTPSGARFLVVTITMRNLRTDGAVFQSPGGRQYIIMKVREREQAEQVAAALGPETRIFAVRPNWSMPDQEWIDADPDFWNER